MRRQLVAILVAMGLMLIFSLFIQAAMQGDASYGGVLLIGPIPIIFGSSPQMALASMLLAIVLMAIVLMAVSVLLIRPKKGSSDGNDSKGDSEVGEGDDRRERSEGFEGSTKIKGGAVVMIGPIPLVIGSDPRTALLLMLLALAIMALWALITKGG